MSYNGFYLLTLEDATLHQARVLLLRLTHAQRGVAAVEHDGATADLGRKSNKLLSAGLAEGVKWTTRDHVTLVACAYEHDLRAAHCVQLFVLRVAREAKDLIDG